MRDINKLASRVFLTAVMSVMVLLRVVSLNYSEYQGDEIQALYLPRPGMSLIGFLMDQKKGPIQYLVTASIKSLSDSYDNRFITRLPFTLAGIGAGLFLFLFVKNIANWRVALLSLVFYSTNGLFVAFSRIVQYQTLVALFITLSLYLAHRFYKTSRYHYLYASFLFWTLGLLTHSDAMFIALPLLAIFMAWGHESSVSPKKFISVFLLPSVILLTVLLSYYIPLVINSSNHTQNYWLGRFSGNITNGIISSTYLFSVYQPIYGLQLYLTLGVVGLGFWSLLVVTRCNCSVVKKFCKYLPACLTGDLVSHNVLISLGILGWFGSAVVFMEVITKFPGTHIWTYLVPLYIFIGFGLERLYNLLRIKFTKVAYVTLLTAVSVFLAYQSFVIFVDHTKEYPWEKKSFLLWELKKPNTGYQLSLFGFPYYRGWDNIAEFLLTDGRSAFYWDNEKASLSKYYVPLERNNQKAGYFLRINRPQTFTSEIINKRGASWMVRNAPIKVFYNGTGRQVASVYLVPEYWGI